MIPLIFNILLLASKQWGVSLGTSNGETYSFPIAFVSKVYMAIASPGTRDYWGHPATINPLSLTQYVVGAYDLRSGNIYWIALGQ